MTDAEIDKIILKYWNIEDALNGKLPDYEDIRKIVREAIAEAKIGIEIEEA